MRDKNKIENHRYSPPALCQNYSRWLDNTRKYSAYKGEDAQSWALSLSFISGILITLCSIAGCSDTPYTGAMLPTDNIVDQCMVSRNEELVCLQNGTDSECLTLIPENSREADSINGPITHIHPDKLVYIFYHEGKEIVRAERITDTTEIVETLTETREDTSSQTDHPSGGIVVRDADDTPQPEPPGLRQTINQFGSIVDDDPNNNNNGDDPPPPPPQITNLDNGSSNPEPTTSHHTLNAMYYDYDGGWYVTIYYPENYIGPRELPNNFGFTITSSNGTIGTKELTRNGVRTLITIGPWNTIS